MAVAAVNSAVGNLLGALVAPFVFSLAAGGGARLETRLRDLRIRREVLERAYVDDALEGVYDRECSGQPIRRHCLTSRVGTLSLSLSSIVTEYIGDWKLEKRDIRVQQAGGAVAQQGALSLVVSLCETIVGPMLAGVFLQLACARKCAARPLQATNRVLSFVSAAVLISLIYIIFCKAFDGQSGGVPPERIAKLGAFTLLVHLARSTGALNESRA